MSEHISTLIETANNAFNYLKDIAINKPLIPPLFPASGLGVSFIPANLVINTQGSNLVLDLIGTITPYLRFLFLILTLVLTIISMILQWRKIRNKDK